MFVDGFICACLFVMKRKKQEIPNDVRNGEGESNEHENQNKSPRTSAMKDKTATASVVTTKNALLFCSSPYFCVCAYECWLSRSLLWEL